MRLSRAALAAILATAVAGPADAVTFSFSTIQGDTLTQAESSAFSTAAAAWTSVLSDPFVVTLEIGFRALASNILGQTAPGLLSGSAAAVEALLALDATSAADVSAVASLPASPAGNLFVTKAQLKALGVAQSGSDGRIEFSSAYTFSTQRSADGTIAAGTFDLVGIATHEIGHLLGFISSLDYGSVTPSLLDGFRYASSGVRSFAAGSGAYFSIDGGVTSEAGFSVGGAGQSQASHWAAGTGGIMDPTFSPGEVRNLAAVDVLALDVIGYDVTVPEPASLALLGFAVGVAAVRRTLGRRTAAK